MKKITALLLLLPFVLLGQIHVDSNWKNIINPTFQNLDKSKIQSGMLLDYAMEFTDVTAYNGILTDTTYVDADVLGNVYKTLFMSKVVADTLNTPLFERFAYNWARERYKATKDSSGVYILSGLAYGYQRFNENALAQNKITVSNGKYYDKYIGGVWQNPYDTKTVFALTPAVLHSRSKDVYFKLPNTLFLSNIGSQIISIQIDAGNGMGYQNLPFNTAVQLHFYENKIHDLIFKITLSNRRTLYCRSKFKIDDPRLTIQTKGAIVVNDNRVYIHEGNNFFNAAWLTIRRIPGNTQITKPLIIAEGLDTGNFTAPEDFGGERTLANFINDIDRSQSVDIENLLIRANTQQYDLIYIDWVRGMADMRDNSRVLEEVIKWVNQQKAVSGSTHPNVLLGQSMGGVIGRYTLARMEKEGKTHNVRLFVAHDSPMQGANTPLAFQHFAAHMKEEYVSTPLAWQFGEVLLPIGYGLAQLGSDFLNFFGANTSVPAYVSPAQLLSLQDQTASKQLNYWSVTTSVNGAQTQTRSFNQSWQQTLTTMGWPLQSRNVAISNGNECGVNHGFAPGAPFLVIDSVSNPGFWLDMLNQFLAPVVGAVRQDLGLIIVGSIPGRSRWQTNFEFNSCGALGAQNRIYYGRIRFEKKILWIGPTIKYDVINRSFNAPAAALPFDTYSGGRFDLVDENGDLTVDVPILGQLVDVVNGVYGFIPVVSALDIKRNNQQVLHADYLKKYAGGVTPEPDLVSGFDAFIVDFSSGSRINNKHISFQVRNGNWLAKELKQESNPVTNCSFVCADNSISGPIRMCTNGSVYSVNAPSGTTPVWTVTQGSNLVTLTNNPNGSVKLTSQEYSGTVTLSATVTFQGCGSATLTKVITIGNNSTNYSVSVVNNYCDSNFQYFVLRPSGLISYNGFSNFSPSSGIFTVPFNGTNDAIFRIPKTYAGQTGFQILAQNNSCGRFRYTFTFQAKACGDIVQPRSQNTAENRYVIYPNPSSDVVYVTLRDENTDSENNSVINAELFDMDGISIRQNLIINNQSAIDVSDLTKGIYILRINIDGIIESHQIMVE